MSPNATDMINRQIEIEMRKLNSIMTNESDKPAIMQRIADLKAMLDVPAVQMDKKEPSARELIADLIKAIRYR